jgi:hypothetical protein
MNNFWNQVFLGNSLKDWSIVIGIIAATLLVLRITKQIVLSRLEKCLSFSINTYVGSYKDHDARLKQARGIVVLTNVVLWIAGILFLIETTRLQSLGGEELIFSNTDLINSRVHNYKRMDKWRIVFAFRIRYGTPVDKINLILNNGSQAAPAWNGTSLKIDS